MNRPCSSAVVPMVSVVVLVLCGSSIDLAQAQDANAADVRFMQDMIHHHAQALEMTALVADRSNNRAIDLMARRIEITQKDEIAWMTDWLERLGEEVPVVHPRGSHTAPDTRRGVHDTDVTYNNEADEDAHEHRLDRYEHESDADRHEHESDADRQEHESDADRHWHESDADRQEHESDADRDHESEVDGHDHATARDGHDQRRMPGMLTREQMDELARASGRGFDRLFLKYMIHHHEGALTMVRDLLATEGAAQETEVFTFVAEVDADQAAEIRRMQTILDALSDTAPDP